MAGQSQIPLYVPGDRGTIAQLLMAQGEAQARGAERSGQIWGNAVNQLGQIASGAVQQYGEDRAAKKREAIVDQALNSWDGNDPTQLYRSLAPAIGPGPAMNISRGMAEMKLSAEKVRLGQIPSRDSIAEMIHTAGELERAVPGSLAKNYSTFYAVAKDGVRQHFAHELPPQLDDETLKGILAIHDATRKKESWEQPQVMKVASPDGKGEVERLVQPTELQQPGGVPVYQKPEKETAVPIEQQYLAAVKAGDTATAQKLLAAHKQFREAGVTVNMAGGGGGGEALSPAGIDVAALRYRKDGTLPTIARDPVSLKRILDRAATLTPADIARIEAGGLDVAANKAGLHADSASLTGMQKQTDAVAAFENTATRNAKMLDGLLAKIPNYGSTWANKPGRELARALGSTDMTAFNTLRQSVANEYARIISNPNLSGVMSDSARSEGSVLLDPDATPEQLRTAIKTLAAEAKNRHTEYRSQLDEIRGRIKGGGSVPSTAQPKADPLGIR